MTDPGKLIESVRRTVASCHDDSGMLLSETEARAAIVAVLKGMKGRVGKSRNAVDRTEWLDELLSEIEGQQ